MKPLQTLPNHYTLLKEIDLSRDRRLLLALNLVGVAQLLLFSRLFMRLVFSLRPDVSPSITWRIDLISLIGIVIALVGVLVLHESVHGLFFWIITRQRPRFGFRGTYAFAAAPDWYLPRNPYLVVGLAPLVLITIAGIAFIPFIPVGGLLPLVYALTINAAGAVGDVAIVAWLLVKPPNLLIQDRGDAVSIYQIESP